MRCISLEQADKKPVFVKRGAGLLALSPGRFLEGVMLFQPPRALWLLPLRERGEELRVLSALDRLFFLG